MSSKQTVSETTIQADVGPGDETGIYYITICNLPFGSSWQELKDWLRQACIVDHIELFRKSTSGWIRLRGKDDFEKALRYINSVDFNGRNIIASDRNRTESIKIKELVETSYIKHGRSPPASPRHAYNQAASFSPQKQYEPQLVATPYSPAPHGQFFVMHGYASCAPEVGGYCPNPAMSHVQAVGDPYAAAAALGNPWTPYGPDSPRDVAYMDRLAPYEYEGYSYHQYAVPYPTPCTSVYSDVPAYGSLEAPESAAGDFIPTEPLKILVTSISQRASPEETIAWIRRKTGRYVAEIIHVDVPAQNHKKNRVRGHAYVIFKSTAAAQGAVQLLHQAVFQNRKISARFTIEGVTAGEQASPSVPGQTEGQREGQRDRERDKGSKEICVARVTESKTRAGSKPRPKACEGSNCCGRVGREKQDRAEARSKSTEMDNKVYHVIADGSSRRLLDRKKA